MSPTGYIWDLDRSLLLAINGPWGGAWDTFWWAVSQPWCWGPLYVVTIWMLYRRLGLRGMLVALGLIVLAIVLADQTANFFKTHTPKFRPSRTLLLWEGVPYNEWVHTVRNAFTGRSYVGGNFGTVSGHAATSMAIAVTSSGILRTRWVSICMAVYVVLTCFSRMYLGVHFPLDILFGLTAGTLIGVLMLWVWKKFFAQPSF